MQSGRDVSTRGEESLGRKALRGSVWMIGWRLLARMMGLLSTIILARVLVPADFGLVGMALAFSASVEAFSNIGVADALVRQRDGVETLYDAAFTIKLVRGVLTGALIAACASAAASWFAEPRLAPMLLVLGAVVAISGADNIGMVEYRRAMQFHVQFQSLLVPRILEVATTITVALVFRTYWALLIGIAVGKLLYVAMTYLLHPYRPRLTLIGWRELMGFSLWSWAGSIARMVWEQMDAFVLGPIVGPARLGAYLLGSGMALLPVTQLVSPIAGVLFPGFAAARNKGSETINLALLVATTLLLAIIPIALTISAASNCIVALLLGPKWADAQPVIAVLAFACIFQPFSYVSASVLIASGHVDRDFRVMATAALAKMPILAVTATAGSLTVIALGSLAAILVEAAAFLWTLHRVGQLRLRRLRGTWIRMMLAGGTATATLYASGIAWQTEIPSALTAIWQGAALGLIATLAFTIAQFGTWWFAKCPEGPEELLLHHVADLLRSPRADALQSAARSVSSAFTDGLWLTAAITAFAASIVGNLLRGNCALDMQSEPDRLEAIAPAASMLVH